MSRYTITVTRNGRSDPDAVIGYDPPLRTFFLQASPTRAATASHCGSAPATANTKRSTHCTWPRDHAGSTSCRFPTTSPRGSPPTSRRKRTGRRMTVRSSRCCDICSRSNTQNKRPAADDHPPQASFLPLQPLHSGVIQRRRPRDNRDAVSIVPTHGARQRPPGPSHKGRCASGPAGRSFPTRARRRCRRTGSELTTADRTGPCSVRDRYDGGGSRLHSA